MPQKGCVLYIVIPSLSLYLLVTNFVWTIMSVLPACSGLWKKTGNNFHGQNLQMSKDISTL